MFGPLSTGFSLLLNTNVLLGLTLIFICLINSRFTNKSECALGLLSKPTSTSLYVKPLNVISIRIVGLVSDGSCPSAFALKILDVPNLGLL